MNTKDVALNNLVCLFCACGKRAEIYKNLSGFNDELRGISSEEAVSQLRKLNADYPSLFQAYITRTGPYRHLADK